MAGDSPKHKLSYPASWQSVVEGQKKERTRDPETEISLGRRRRREKEVPFI